MSSRRPISILALVLVPALAAEASAATINATRTLDDSMPGECSLRDAVRSANTDTAVQGCTAGSGADTIVLTAQPYLLTVVGSSEDGSLTGDLDVTSTISISGAGAIIGAPTGDRAFHVLSSGDLTLSAVTIQLGTAPFGGAVLNAGALTVISSTFDGNTATGGVGTDGVGANTGGAGGGGGGAIFNQAGATVALTNVQFTNNEAAGGDGGNGGSRGGAGGGGGGGGGGAIFNDGGTINGSNLTFTTNSASGGDGGFGTAGDGSNQPGEAGGGAGGGGFTGTGGLAGAWNGPPNDGQGQAGLAGGGGSKGFGLSAGQGLATGGAGGFGSGGGGSAAGGASGGTHGGRGGNGGGFGGTFAGRGGGGGGGGLGGAIYSQNGGVITISVCSIGLNTAAGGDGGAPGPASQAGSAGQGAGGGVYQTGAGVVTLLGCTLTGNDATSLGDHTYGNVIGGPIACGNAVPEIGEVCDDGNLDDTDACPNDCGIVAPVCGNGVEDAGETCDDNNTITEECAYGQASCTVCDATCQEVAGETDFCGDGTEDSAETCDDSNTITEECAYGDTSCTVCDATCQDAAGETDFCGDGTEDSVETCDDFNAFTEECSYGDTSCTVCDATCQDAAGETDFCGDSTPDLGFEDCDTNGDSATCDNDCTTPACHDGVENLAAEECDDDDLNNTNACTNVCELPVCGDGIVTPSEGEQCDDGGTADDDGCSSACQLDPVDFDADGVLNDEDNCPFVPNNNQFDSDGDGAGDACDDLDNDNHDGDDYDDDEDNCPFVPNDEAPDDQLDDDGDGVGNACDATDGNDVDGDGDLNEDDNCPFEANGDQADTDGDGLGNVCDPLDDDDVDADGDDNGMDNCPFDANADQADADGDGLGDACDLDTGDAADLDADGEDNATDNCPFIFNESQADADEDGLGDACDDLDNTDVDGDGEPNGEDNCPFDANDDQDDADDDGLGDACDDLEDEDTSVVVNGAGCDAGGGSGLGGLALIGLAVALLRGRRRDARHLVVLLVVLAPVTAMAQTTTFDADLGADRFILTSDPTSIGLTESAAPLASRVMAVGLAMRLGGAPLTVCVEDDDGACTIEGDIVGDRVGMDLTYAMGFGRFGIHAQLPLVLHQSSDFEPAMGEEALAAGGLGDLRLGAKAWFLRKAGVTVGGDLTCSLPTNTGNFIGDAGTVIEPRALVDWRKGRVALAGSLGYALRTADQTVADLHVDDELLFTVGAEYAITPDKLTAGLALSSRIGLMGPPDEMIDTTDEAERLTEALASARYWVTDSIAIEGGAGTALESGYGAPSYRVLAGVRWMHAPKPRPPAPIVVEEAPPPPPVVVEEPPPAPVDTDGDGLVDPVDECPTDPEDPDAFEDENGCPDPDNDQDTILDPVDACPLEAETMNGFEDDNGCPDERPAAVVTATAVEIYETIFFDLNKAKIKSKSHDTLDAVASALINNPDLRVRVEGHTDDTGTESWNQTLSENRAKAVMDYLIAAGVAADRLESAGYGATAPLAEGDSDKARAKNRRVEFKIIQ